jgi:soluble lytic murein transglycosylase-like protein
MRLTMIVALAVAGAVAVTPARAADGSTANGGGGAEMATLVPGVPEVVADLPAILSDADTKLYHQIFEIQEDGRWKDADRLIATLTDRVLMGHVMAQRYLHPRKYRSRYKELKAWLAQYADHPEAGQLYKLALKRKPKNWLKPRAPVRARGPGMGPVYGVAGPTRVPGKYRDKSLRRKARVIRNKIRSRLRHGWTKSVKRLLGTKEVQTVLSRAEYDEARARLGFGYFVAGRDEWALMWAGKAAKRSGKYLPRAYWTAGLAAWRLGRFETAAENFEAVARHRRQSTWMIAAGAFWAARAHLVGRRPEEVNHWLGVAATYTRTFYGQLARRMLGLETRFNWAAPAFDASAVEAVAEKPEGRRALALIQVGEDRMAERELKLLAGRAGPGLARGILALAARTDMPALGVKLDRLLFPGGGGFDGAAYPVPGWAPPGGFRVDRALIYALIRQESQFNPKAKSYAGASGLMQLMPRTASFVARDRRYRGSRRRHLFEPEVNLRLGQKYIELLLRDAKIKGDLFLMVTAWNGGPGNLNKWRRQIKHMNDPLFFIESIPSRETRNFIERVFTNLWVYRDRLGQPAPSLDAIAAGAWPVYIPQDQKSLRVAADGKDRR